MSKGITSEEFLKENPELIGTTAEKVTVAPVDALEKVKGRLSKPTYYPGDKGVLIVVNIEYPSDAPPVARQKNVFYKVFFTDSRFFGDISSLNGEIKDMSPKDRGNFNRQRTALSKLLAAANTTLDGIGDQEIEFDAGPAYNDAGSYQVNQIRPLTITE